MYSLCTSKVHIMRGLCVSDAAGANTRQRPPAPLSKPPRDSDWHQPPVTLALTPHLHPRSHPFRGGTNTQTPKHSKTLRDPPSLPGIVALTASSCISPAGRPPLLGKKKKKASTARRGLLRTLSCTTRPWYPEIEQARITYRKEKGNEGKKKEKEMTTNV